MSHHVIEASAHSNASRDAVWALVRDITTWQDWGTWSSTTVETPMTSSTTQETTTQESTTSTQSTTHRRLRKD